VSRRHSRGVLVAAGALAGVAGTALAAGRRWRRSEDPCAATVLDLENASAFKVERPDGAVLDGVSLGPEGGPMIVLSHCWTGSRATWDAVAARLVAAGRRVVLYDQRGHGASTMGPDAPTVDQLGEDLAAVLEAVDARGAVLAGHSMGGMALQALAVAHADVVAQRVRALVLAGTTGFGVAAGPMAGPALFLTGNPTIERLVAGRPARRSPGAPWAAIPGTPTSSPPATPFSPCRPTCAGSS
jgi:pimeloyl-ACP methyl ester carboxylesterase